MADRKTRHMIAIALSVLILAGAFAYYFNYRLGLVRQDYEAKIGELGRQNAESLKSAQNALERNISALGSNLSLQIGAIGSSLADFKKQNQREISTLSSLIDQIEQQSNIKLNELKTELKDIQIKSADFSAIVNDVLQSIVSVKTNVGQGSGAIIGAKGYVITNVHVISGASSIKVLAYSGDTYDVDAIAGYDANADIAVLKISAPNLKSLSFGDSDSLKVGEKVIAAGNPAGLAFTVTEGIVSAFRTGSNGIQYVQTDVPINPGNSGGPLINARGEIVGINDFKVSGNFEGLGFAISSNDASKVAGRIISDYEARQNQ